MRKEKVKTILIEDNPAEVELLQIAFERTGIDTEFIIHNDGAKALDYLNKLDEEMNDEAPQIIILDLNLPSVSGKEILKNIKSDEKLRKLPVIVLSSSKEKKDIEESYQLYANSYVEKNADFREFLKMTEAIKHFWYERNKQ